MGPPIRLVALLLLAGLIAGAVEREPWETYRQRRRQLAAAEPSGAVVLFGLSDHEGRQGPAPFRQENNFYYLTGCNEPGAALLLIPPRDGRPYEETLFLPRSDPSRRRWDGPRIDPESATAPTLTGFDRVEPASRLERAISAAAERLGSIRALTTPSGHGSPRPAEHQGGSETIALAAPRARVEDARGALMRMRMVKTPEEIRFIREAVDASVDAHLAAWERLRPGLREYQIGATMTGVLLERGCLRPAYAPIIGGGRNGLILHYAAKQAKLEAGDLVLIDVGGEYAHYAADLTRTVPVAGRFSKRQRELYEIVLGVQQAVIAAVKPGMTLAGDGPASLTAIAEDLFEKAGRGLSRNFVHAVGHQVGLAVHDPGPTAAKLEPGMVITVEPGLYLNDEGLAIRIEDMVLVTEEGAEVLSADLPKRAAEIERLLRKKSPEAVSER